MSTVADYVGRTVDILAYDGQNPTKEVLLTAELAMAGGGGQICTGAQKLGQQWLIEFLTVRGTKLHDPDAGCDFMGQLYRGEIQTTLDAEQAFYLSAGQVGRTLEGIITSATPDDEAYEDAELLSLTISGDLLKLNVRIVSRAGTSREVILPIDVLPQR